MGAIEKYVDHITADALGALREGRFDDCETLGDVSDKAFADNTVTGNGVIGERPVITEGEEMFIMVIREIISSPSRRSAVSELIDWLSDFPSIKYDDAASIRRIDTAIRCWLLDDAIYGEVFEKAFNDRKNR